MINKDKITTDLCPASVWHRPPWCRWPLGPRCTCCGCGSWVARPDLDWPPRSSSAAPVLSAPPPSEWPEDFSEQTTQKPSVITHADAPSNINISIFFFIIQHMNATRRLDLPRHTCLRRAIDSLGMISLRLRREMKHRAWYWFCPLSSSPRIRARNIFTSCKT